MEPAIAGALASILAFAELKGALKRKRVSWRAIHWVLARMGVDGLLGAAAYSPVAQAMGVTAWPGSLLSALVAGFAATAVLRGQVLVGSASKELGVGVRYQQWLALVADEIDDISSTAESQWLWDKAVPALALFPPAAVRDRGMTYLRGRGLSTSRLNMYEEFFSATVLDQNSLDERKCAVIAQKLLDVGGRRCVSRIARSAKREAKRKA